MTATMEELFRTLESPLLAYADRLTGDRSVAEDIVQEAFMRLHEQFEGVEEPRPWLFRAVRNLALNHQRSRRKEMSLEAAQGGGSEGQEVGRELTDPQPMPDEQIARWEGIGLVRLGMAALDERSRDLLHLKFNEELSYKEISVRTGLTVGHVGYLIHHALKAITAELAQTGVVP